MRITSKGQVTIPQHIREQCGLLPGTDIDFVVEADGRVVIVELDAANKHRRTCKSRGELVVDHLRGRLGPNALTTDAYMNMLRGYDEDASDPGLSPTAQSGVA